MKKVLSLVLCFVLVAVMALPAFAASYTVGDNGNAVYDNAHGYVFGIDSINGTVNETVVIFDSQESYDACASVWSIYIHLNKVADNVYVAAQNAVAGDGSKPAYVVAESDIVLVAHSSSSNPTQADSYPNWQDKVAAVAVKAGDYFTFSGVDLEAGTVAAGATATCTAENPAKPADKVINLLAEAGEMILTSDDYDTCPGDTTDIVATLENGVFTAQTKCGFWPNAEYRFTTPVTVNVEGAYLEVEASVTGGNGASIRLLGTDSGVCSEDIFLHQFGEGVTLDTGSGDGSGEYTLSYKMALKDMAFCDYRSEVQYAGKLPITSETVSFSGIFACPTGNATVTITKLNLIVPGEGGEEVVIVKGDNVALNKTYTNSLLYRQRNASPWDYDENADIAYPDTDNKELTDGKLPEIVATGENLYTASEWVGLHGQTPDVKECGYAWITVDLGKVTDIYSVASYFGTGVLGGGIGAPSSVEVFVSNDNENWTSVGKATPTNPADTNCEKVEITCEEGVSGQYVQFRMVSGGWVFVSEIEVYEAVKSTSGGNKPEVIVETITVDGDLTDTGWLEDGWTIVNKDNGTFQGGIGLTNSIKNAASMAFSYKFQMRTDDTKLYVAAIYDCKIEEIDGKSYGTKFRLWLNTNEEATVYTHFYDIYTKGGVIVAEGKYNTSTTENKGAMIGATEGNSAYSGTLVGTMKEVNGKTYFEMSVDLAEFGGEEGFNYFFNAGHKTVDGENTDNIQMLYPAVPVPEDSVNSNFPYAKWYAANDATADVEALKLGERVVDPEEPEEQPDTSMMGTAPTDSKFTATVSGPEAWKAGDKFTVDVTIEVTADELELSQIMFNLFYDAADVELTLPEELGAVNITTGADSWKGEDSMMTVSEVDGYGKIEVSLATVEEADVLKKGDKIVVSFEFTVKEEAEGLINFQLSNEELNGYTYDDPATALAGTGSNLAIAPAGDNLGDAGIYAIAALAVIALIGTAVVIKKRA